MKHAIEFHSTNADYLSVGPRKSYPHASAILVNSGVVLVRLGKFDVPISQGQMFWIPSGCLSAITVLQGAKVSTFHFSVRSTVDLPTNAGFIKRPELAHQIALQLVRLQGENLEDWNGPYGRLCRCVRDFISLSMPCDKYDAKLRQAIAHISELDKSGQIAPSSAKELAHTLKVETDYLCQQLIVRTWVRSRKSGQRIEKIAKTAQRPAEEIALLMEKFAGTI